MTKEPFPTKEPFSTKEPLQDALTCGSLFQSAQGCGKDVKGELVRYAEALVQKHYLEKFSLRQLSDSLHVDKSYLLRTFHERTGMTLLEYAVFDLIFMSVYFTELKLPKSILCSLTGFFLSIALLEVLVQVVPPFRAVLDSLDTSTILWRLLVFFIGVVGFIVGNIAAFRIACKRFLRYNM